MPTMPRSDDQTGVAARLESHQYRAVAESFGVDPAGYDRWRPRYPQPLIDRILANSPGQQMLDVGIGTGIVARQLREAGALVTGVEPDARMAAFARDDGFVVEESTIEDWDPAGRTFDALVAGQAWHWVDPVVGGAKARQALRPGGRVALFWTFAEAPAEVNRAYAEAFAAAVPDSPIKIGNTPPRADQAYATIADNAANGLREAGGFARPERWQDSWDQAYTREEYLAMLPTTGMLTRVPAQRVAPVLAAVGAVIDRLGGSFVTHCVTTTVTSVRLSE